MNWIAITCWIIWAGVMSTCGVAIVQMQGYYARLDRYNRWRAGRCADCGYDVRATPERCPECGERLPLPPVNDVSSVGRA